jgi:3-isopropylmalate/(R)-2-methylmalate dehydratase small subunit
MKRLDSITGIVAPLDKENVDTDAIIPKQFLKSTARTGYGTNLFDAWRYLDEGVPNSPNATRQPNPYFVLNQPRYQSASILLARNNFGCGSSREHAPWALLQAGFDAVIAPGFGDIFRNNSLKNGLLVVELFGAEVDWLFDSVAVQQGFALRIDVQAQQVHAPQRHVFDFELDPFRKRCLVEGLDELTLALAAGDEIRAWERRKAAAHPWAAHGLSGISGAST